MSCFIWNSIKNLMGGAFILPFVAW